MINIQISSPQQENLKERIQGILNCFREIVDKNLADPQEIPKIESDLILKEIKANNITTYDTLNHEILKNLFVCASPFYYTSLLDWASKNPTTKNIIQGWNFFINAIKDSTLNDNREPKSKNPNFNSRIYKTLFQIKDLVDKDEIAEELSTVDIFFFISDIIRYLLYSTIHDINIDISFMDLFKITEFEERINEQSKNIEEALNTICEGKEVDNYDFTEIVLFILKFYSLRNKYDISEVYHLQLTIGKRTYIILGRY